MLHILYTYLDWLQIPAVKRILQKLIFNSAIIERKTSLLLKPISIRINFFNVLLINAIIFAYWAGKAEAQSTNQFIMIYQNYAVIGKYLLVTSFIALLLRYIRWFFVTMLKAISIIIIVILSLFITYWLLRQFFHLLDKINNRSV